MSNQPAPARPWLRLPSIARPATPAPTPTPEPPPPQPRPAFVRPAFRPGAQPPPPAAATGQPPVASLPTSPTLRVAGGVSSLPASPAPRAPAPSSSVPPSPVPTSTALPVTTSSLPPSPTPKPAVPSSSSVPTSPAPAPKPAPSASVPTSPVTKPVTTTSSVQTSPKPGITKSSVPNSPASKAVTTTATRVPSPGSSLRTIKPSIQTPPQSPKTKTTAPPPSPLTLPPSQVKSDADAEPRIPLVAEQKNVLVQKTIDKPQGERDSLRELADSISSSISHLANKDTSKNAQTKEKGNHKKISSDSENDGMKVITIAGENKGAFMEVIRSPKKHVFEGNSQFLHKKGYPRTDGSSGGGGCSSGGEEGHMKKDKNHKGRGAGPSPLSAFMNTNVQGVNNSIVYNSSCSHHDPGVHVALSRKPAGVGFHVKDRGNGYQS